MRDEDKPFIWLKSSGGFRISPRNAEGWKWMMVWTLALVPICGLFGWILSFEPRPALVALCVGLFVLTMIGWSVAMIRWMMARSEVIDINELLKLKRELDARKAAGKR
jgi:hypothetical protein